MTFNWYISLPPNFVQNWAQVESMFNAQFYRNKPEISMANLAKIKQQPGKKAETTLLSLGMLEVQLPEREYVSMPRSGVNFELRKKFEDRSL